MNHLPNVQPPASTYRLRLDLHGPIPTSAFATSGGTMLHVGPIMLLLPDARTALALWVVGCEIAHHGLRLLPAGEDLGEGTAIQNLYASHRLEPETIKYQVRAATASPTGRPVAVITAGAIVVTFHDGRCLRDLLAGSALAYDLAHRGCKAPTAHGIARMSRRRRHASVL